MTNPAHPPRFPKVLVWTDGGCCLKTRTGGWGVVLTMGEHRKELSGCDSSPEVTNNRMELTAAIRALEALTRKCSVVLHTDSQYVVNGITKWIEGWHRRGWVTRDNGKEKPIANRDLWEQLYALRMQHRVDWVWVRGHAGNENNEVCDRLATAARLTLILDQTRLAG